MNFASDNWSGATPAVMEAIGRANSGFAPAYGDDDLTAEVGRTFAKTFDRDVEVHFVTSGTAANILCLSAVGRPSGYVLCSDIAHIHTDEFAGTEFATGMKLWPVPTVAGKITPETLTETLRRLPPAGHRGPLTVLSLTNATEYGTVYRAAEIAALAEIARANGMKVHLDGARFANAVAAAGETPAALTWQAGVDLMSFGGTKNGCWAAEAIVIFSPRCVPGHRRT